jgi:hypothetical protein
LEKEAAVQLSDDELQMLDRDVTAERNDDENQQASQRSGLGGVKAKHKKIPKKMKRSPKKSSGDALVGVMQRFVDIKEKESKKEDASDFSISRCMTELKKLAGVTPDVNVKCYDVIKCPKNCEIFINAVAEEDGSALAWLHSQIGNHISCHLLSIHQCYLVCVLVPNYIW